MIIPRWNPVQGHPHDHPTCAQCATSVMWSLLTAFMAIYSSHWSLWANLIKHGIWGTSPLIQPFPCSHHQLPGDETRYENITCAAKCRISTFFTMIFHRKKKLPSFTTPNPWVLQTKVGSLWTTIQIRLSELTWQAVSWTDITWNCLWFRTSSACPAASQFHYHNMPLPCVPITIRPWPKKKRNSIVSTFQAFLVWLWPACPCACEPN